MKKSKEDLEAERADWLSFWREKLQRNDEFVYAVGRDGIKYSMISHATAAVICFQAFLSPESAKFRTALLVIMFCAFIGLAASAIGQIVLLESVSHFTDKVRGRLVRKKHMRFLASIPVYGDRVMGASMKWSGRLIYGSVIWLGIYLFIGLNFLANS